MRKDKKGFTIVELVIVIAVIAILAAVLIPTFSSVIGNAQRSADTQLCKNINKALAMQVDGKNATMSEALDYIAENGYNVDRLTPTTEGYMICWDQSSDRVVLLKDDQTVYYSEEQYEGETPDFDKLWMIVHNETELNTYKNKFSIYLADDYGAVDTITVDRGFDVGKTTGVNVIYETAATETATVRTNGGTLTVNAENATVNHYGKAESVTITAIANESYHLYGQVNGNINLAKGRVVAESGSSAAAVLVTASAAEDIKVDIKTAAEVGAVAATNANVLKDNVTVADSKNTDVVQDVINQEHFAGGVGTENSPYQIATAYHFLNIRHYSSTMEETAMYFELIADIDCSQVDYSGMLGTYGQLLNKFKGVLEGNGHSFAGHHGYLATSATGAEVRNLTSIQSEERRFAFFINNTASVSVTFENVTIKGETSETLFPCGGNYSSFISQANSKSKVTFKNCTNELNLDFLSYGGIFLGGYALAGAKISYINCTNKAIITGKSVGFFTGNPNQGEFVLAAKEDFSDVTDETYAYAYVENCANIGSMSGTVSCSAFATGTEAAENTTFNEKANNALVNNPVFQSGRMVKASTVVGLKLAAEENGDKMLSIVPGEGVDTYVVEYYVSMSFKSATGTSCGTAYIRVREEVKASEVANWKGNYVSKAVGSAEYGKAAYDALAETEQTDISGYKFKLVKQEDGTYLLVANSDSIVELFNGLMHTTPATSVVFKDETTKYTITAKDASQATMGSAAYLLGTF